MLLKPSLENFEYYFGFYSRATGFYSRVNGDLHEGLCCLALPRTAAVSSPVTVAGHCWPTPLHKTLKHSQVGLTQSPVGSLHLSPGSWCAQILFCVLQEFLFPLILQKFFNQIPLAFKVRFPRGFPVPWLDPQAGEPYLGPRTFITVWELLWYHCSPVCESPTLQV